MPADKPLIEIGDWSKPATRLIERIADAVGAFARPYQMVRMANAEAECRRIEATAQVEVTEIERRGMERRIREEGKQQENMENIAAGAAAQLGDDAKPEDLDDDWLVYFFEKCRIVSNKDMRTLWSNLLAGETSQPGSYSKMTVNFVSRLDKSDAELFTKFCAFVWNIGRLCPMILDYREAVFRDGGISFDVLQHLEEIGLVSFYPGGNYARSEFPELTLTAYYGRHVMLQFPGRTGGDIPLGYAALTRVGRELAPICGSVPDDDFFDYVLRFWTDQSLRPFTPLE